jgi:hypothetical protein
MIVRLIAAAAVLISAADHLKLWSDEMKDVHVIGPLFLVNVASGVVIAGLLIGWRHWLAPLLAAGFGAATLGGFIIASSPAGLFGDHESWAGGYVFVATVVEIVAIVAGLYAFTRERSAGPVPERAVVRSDLG